MPETINQTASHNTHSDQLDQSLTLVPIEQALEELDAQAEQLGQEIEAALGDMPADDQDAVYEAAGAYIIAAVSAHTTGEEAPIIEETAPLLHGLPVGIKTLIGASVQLAIRESDLNEQLDAIATERATDVAAEIIVLENSLDYDALVARISSDFTGDNFILARDLSSVIRARQLLMSGKRITHHELAGIENMVSSFASEARKQGVYLSEDASETHSEQTDQLDTNTSLHEAVDDASKALEAIDHYSGRYRLPSDHQTGNYRSRLRLMGEYLSYNADEEISYSNIASGHNGFARNDQLDAALRRYTANIIDTLPAKDAIMDIDSEQYRQFVEAARAIDAVEAAKAIEITGDLASLPFDFDEEALRELLIESVPAIALKSTKRLELRPMTSEEDKEDNTAGFCRYEEELDGHLVVISTSSVNRMYTQSKIHANTSGDSVKDPEGYAQNVAKRDMTRTIAHEFGHVFHDVVTIADMHAWDEARGSDPTNITRYVEQMHDSDHPHRYMEDTADPFSYYATDPFVLLATSKARYDGMLALQEAYMPDSVQAQKQRLVTEAIASSAIAGGMKEAVEEIKRLYLSHENEAATETKHDDSGDFVT